MKQKVPRLVLAGTNSGCGKTTVTCAVLQALVSRGLRVGAAKCGPDYIDPMFHSRIIGAKSSNLDAFFFDPDTLRYLLARNARGCDVTVIEGVMGYYDGLGLTSTRASTYEVARETQSPVCWWSMPEGRPFPSWRRWRAFSTSRRTAASVVSSSTGAAP